MTHRLLCALGALCFVGVSAFGGPLEPPAGPVSSTMKAIDEIEPRVALNDVRGDEGATVLITSPGQYYLTSDLVGEPGKHGVRIVAAGDVRIDLNGFSLTGVAGSLNGIDMAVPVGSSSSLDVRCGDGSCRSTISGWGGDGVRTENVIECACTHLIVEHNGGAGIRHLHPEGVIHRDIATRNNLGDGTHVTPPVQGTNGRGVTTRHSKCRARSNGGSGWHIDARSGGYEVAFDGCYGCGNGADGIRVSEAASSKGGAGGGGRIAVLRTSVRDSGEDGLHIAIPCASPTVVSLVEVSCVSNDGDGMEIDAFGGAAPHFGAVCTIIGSQFSSNGGDGLRSENPLHTESTVSAENALFGARVSGGDESTQMLCGTTTHFISNGGGGALCGPGRFAGVEMSVSDNGGTGVEVSGGCLLLTDSSVTNNDGDGVRVDGTLNVVSSNFRRNTGSGVVCVNGECVMEDAVGEFNGAGGNGNAGFEFADVSSVIMRRCVARGNTGDGVFVRSSVGPVRWMAPEMISERNTRHGISLNSCVGAVLERCVTGGNGGVGIFLDESCTDAQVERCRSTHDGAGGIWVLGSGSLVLGCRATESASGAFQLAQDAVAAPVITKSDVPTNRNADANIVY